MFGWRDRTAMIGTNVENDFRIATVIGGSGFIGSALCHHLGAFGWNVWIPERNDPLLFKRDLGVVFYCAGLTANFRERPFDTVEAHIQVLSMILQYGKFTSLVYLSSTRVYANSERTTEDSPLLLRSDDASDLYNLSKLMGESLCLNSSRSVRIARLSNVYGVGMPEKIFLAEVLIEACRTGHVRFRSSINSEKDYISVSEVVRILPSLLLFEENGIFNVASGNNISNKEIANQLECLGISFEFEKGAPEIRFPMIDIGKLKAAIGGVRNNLIDDFPTLFNKFGEKNDSNRAI